MADCDRILGDWESLLVFDAAPGSEEEVEDDGVIEIFLDAGAKKGRHHKLNGSTVPVKVECKEIGGGRVNLTLTEVDGQTTTVYKGKAVYLPQRDTLVIVKGRVQRRTPHANLAADNGDADWSSEKPT